MQNKRNNNQAQVNLDNIIERLKGNSRLSLDDKKIFALNLGKLAISH